jgi:methyl-accepting chemotaxis protein
MEELEEKARLLTSDSKLADQANKDALSLQRQMNEIVLGQNAVTQETSASLLEIGATISSLAAISSARRTAIGAVVASIETQRMGMANAVEGIANIRESSQDVLGMADLILNISEKTDLLAMNASIEAAHAGSSGKGFAVIASEIRKLSDETKRGTSSIAAALKKNTTAISAASTAIADFASGLEGMLAEVRSTLNSMEEIVGGLAEMGTATQQINAATTSLTGIARRTEEGAAKMAKSMEFGAKSIEGISRFSEQLYAATSAIQGHFVEIEVALGRIEDQGKRNIEHISALGAALKAIEADDSPS